MILSMKNTLYQRLLLLLAVPLLAASCSDNDDEVLAPGNLQVQIAHVVGAQPLQLDVSTYTSPAGDSYTVSNFKYYISNVKLIGANGQATFVEPESYHLVGQGLDNTFELKAIPAGTYDKIELSVGVDAAHNHSTDQEGDLDPSNEMVWNWDTGYKFMTLVGSYTGNTKSGALVFHIGGDANYKTITLPLPTPVDLLKKSDYQLRLQADLNEIFQAPHLIDFDEMNTGGHGVGPSMLAENYSEGFLKATEVQ